MINGMIAAAKGINSLEEIWQMLQLKMVWQAVIVGALVAVCTALLGVSLVLKRYSMIGDGLSHVGFGALAIGMTLERTLSAAARQYVTPMTVALPVVMLAAFLLLRLSENSKIKGDAVIALISSSALAIGVAAIYVNSGSSLDVCNYLFGNIMTVKPQDVYLSVGVAAVVLVLYVLFYNRIFAVTFDESFARATGTKAGWYNTLLALLTALVIVIGMRVMGAMLISSLIIFPALTAMRLLNSFKRVVICAAVLSITCFMLGILVALAFNMPTGASVVLVNLCVFLLFSGIGWLKRRGFA